MLRRVIPTAVLLALTANIAATAQSPAPDSAAALALGQKLSGWLWTAEVDSLWAHADDASRTTLQSPNNLAEEILDFIGRFGAETTVVREELARQGDNYRYTRVVRLEAAEEPWTLVWTLAPDLRVMELDLQPGS